MTSTANAHTRSTGKRRTASVAPTTASPTDGSSEIEPNNVNHSNAFVSKTTNKRVALSANNHNLPHEHDNNSSGEPQGRDQGTRSILSDLPTISDNAFTNFDTSIANIIESNPAPLYLASHRDIPPSHYIIPLERKRCLIRALTSSACQPSSQSQQHKQQQQQQQQQQQNKKRPAPSTTERDMKRHKWSSLDRDRKHACLIVACNAAYKCSSISQTLYAHLKACVSNAGSNPDSLPLIDRQNRQVLADSVSNWTTQELREYLTRAGFKLGAMARHEMVSTVFKHIGPHPNGAGEKDEDDGENIASSEGGFPSENLT